MILPVMMLALLAQGSGPANDGEALLQRINEAHRSTWFTTMIFAQHTTYPSQPNRPAETWYETMERPGKLRIDIERDGELTGGMIFRNDTLYQFSKDGLQSSRPMLHPLLILLHDVHVAESADGIIRKLRALNFDLATTSKAQWDGKEVFVVGAKPGDMSSPQFWVDPDELVVVRVIQGQSDTQMRKFSREGSALVERDIRFHNNGNETMGEEYTWVKTGVQLNPKIFEPAELAAPAWIVGYKKTLR